MTTLAATFTIDMRPGEPLPAAAGRFDFTKTWTGEVDGTSSGIMLTAGDPATGSAGYVAIEIFEGTLDGRHGAVTLQQLGTMTGGDPVLQYVLVPGSGTDGLAGVHGSLTIDGITDDGLHRVTVELA